MTRVPEPPIPTAAQFRLKGNQALLQAASVDSVSKSATWGSMQNVASFYPHEAPGSAPRAAKPKSGGDDGSGAFLTALDDIENLSRAEAEELMAEYAFAEYANRGGVHCDAMREPLRGFLNASSAPQDPDGASSWTVEYSPEPVSYTHLRAHET